MSNFAKEIIAVNLEDEMKQSYLDYAMSVIVGRALPDVRDGLKPVHRRVLYAMSELGNDWNKPYKKSARVVGDVIGKYHPHGDTAVYDTMVRMAQPFSMRYMLIDGQGNFGCFTGDTKIKLLDGTEKSFAELAKLPDDEVFYVYATDKEGRIVVGEGRYSRITRKNAELIELTLDSGEKIRCTPDHRFLLRDGTYKQAQYLTIADSLMAGRFDSVPVKAGLNDYLRIYQPITQQYEFVHCLADKFNQTKGLTPVKNGAFVRLAQGNAVKESNAQRLQDNPDMMQQLTAQAVQALKANWQNPDYKKQIIKQKIARYGSQLVTEFGAEQLTPALYENQRHANWIPCLTTALNYFQDFSELKHAAQNYNHRVVATRWLEETADVYDITVDDYHNFLLADGVFVHNSVDGDSPAAMRYTEVRMSKIAHELLADLDKETVDFIPNYDESESEPGVLPTRIPTLLINGSAGIAVGMATNIPPHNLGEVISACLAMCDNPDVTVIELMQHMPGPDFPTAAIINGASGIYSAYTTGRGKIYLRARCHFEDIGDTSRQAIIVTELPYQVNKARLLEKIAELVKEGKIDGISGLRDESDKEGMRMVIELKRNEMPDVVLNNLYKQTQFETVFGINMVALLDGRPHCMNLKEIIAAFIDHRREIITRRTLYLLRKARERAHVLEGLAVALANIDDMIELIKTSASRDEAKERLLIQKWNAGLVASLLERADADRSRPEDLAAELGLHGGLYQLSETQAQAILDLRLHRLTGLEQDKIVGEYQELLAQIDGYLFILANDSRLMEIIREELAEIKAQYADPRRTEIVQNQLDLSDGDLITEEDMVVTMSHEGYVKSQPLTDYKAQRRGGRGKSATAMKETDYIDKLIVANTHDTILCFSSLGKVYWLKVYQLPVASRAARGKPFVNLLPLEDGEKINALLPIREFSDNKFIFMATSEGTVKKTPLNEFERQRSTGKIAIDLHEGDTLVGVAVTDGQQNVLLFCSSGKAVCFNETDVRSMGRTASGVRGMRVQEGHKVISLIIATEGTVLNITENGYGKRTKLEEFTCHKRGGQGLIAIQTSERNGAVVGAVLVNDNDEIMLISDGGTLVRTRVDEISVVGRNTQGVTIIRLDKGEKVIGVDRIAGLAGEDETAHDDDMAAENGDGLQPSGEA